MSRRGVALLAALCVCGVSVAGCGDKASSEAPRQDATGEQPPDRGSGPRAEQAQAFMECLRDNGVELPDAPAASPQGGGGAPPFDPQDSDVQAAFEACQDKLPQGARPPGNRSPPPPGLDEGGNQGS